MGFVVGAGEQAGEERAVPGHWQKVAVDCWFTTTGRAMPRMVKYEDADGCLQMIRDIHVIKQEQKNFAGIYRHRFDCRAEVDEYEREFILLFHVKEHTWDMVIP